MKFFGPQMRDDVPIKLLVKIGSLMKSPSLKGDVITRCGMDALAWTKMWMQTIEKVPEIPTDEGTMIGWFANAIMAGYDARAREEDKDI